MTILRATALGNPPWPTLDPFLFCVHHVDHYPAGNGAYGPAASLAGRSLGMDFSDQDRWSMYHGHSIPGFPRHPHRGFETVSIVRQGLVDHSDSLGASARIGAGDVQWMTAGSGIVHSEMFPLLHTDKPNPTELFQLWLNLPAEDKMVPAHFTMMWRETIPRQRHVDASGKASEFVYIAGAPEGLAAPAPPPSSWASRAEAAIGIWTVSMESGATAPLPPTQEGVSRAVYVVQGQVQVAGETFEAPTMLVLDGRKEVSLTALGASELLVLQGRPIGEPVVAHGPFVMNDGQGIRQAIKDYQRTEFGGWPWPSDVPVHGDRGRFADHGEGEEERPPRPE